MKKLLESLFGREYVNTAVQQAKDAVIDDAYSALLALKTANGADRDDLHFIFALLPKNVNYITVNGHCYDREGKVQTDLAGKDAWNDRQVHTYFKMKYKRAQ